MAITDNLKAYYKLGAESGIDFIGSNNLTPSGAIQLAGSGIIGDSSKFNDGPLYILEGPNSDFKPATTDNFTVSAWVSIDNVTTGIKTIASLWGTGSNLSWRLLYNANNNQFQLDIIDTIAGVVSVATSSFPTIQNNKWYFVVAGLDKEVGVNEIFIGINGSGQDTAPLTGNIDTTINSRFMIGALDTNPPTAEFIGDIDEVAFWKADRGGSEPLTSGEISQLYNNGQGWRPFHTNITNIIDPSGNGDYTSLIAWDAAEARDLTIYNESVLAECRRGNCDFEDTTLEWPAADTGNFITIKAADGHRHQGVFSTDVAYLGGDSNNTHMDCRVPYTVISGMLFDARTNFWRVLSIDDDTDIVGGGCVVQACYILGNGDAADVVRTGNDLAIQPGLILKNSILIDGNTMIDCNPTGQLYVFNCIIVSRFADAFESRNAGAVLTEENNYVVSSGAGSVYYDGLGGIINEGQYTASSHGTETTIQNIPFDNTTFNEIGTDIRTDMNLHLVDGSLLVGSGTDLRASGVIFDIDGQSRPSVFDIGPDQHWFPAVSGNGVVANSLFLLV
jgi:hypothetical protein